MKLLIVLLLITSTSFGQTDLKFDHLFVDSQDKWVAFNKGEDGRYSYAFIYIDQDAGLTAKAEGFFTINDKGEYVPELLGQNVRVRLEPNDVMVAFIPADRFKQLGITETPDWLTSYKQDSASVGYLTRMGFYYNHWDRSAKALTYLERAYAIDKTAPSLPFELAYAYNATDKFAQAEQVAKAALAAKPNECYLYKELAFSQSHLNNVPASEATTRAGIKVCTEDNIKCELAYNLAYEYYKARDKANFDVWVKETMRWAKSGDQFTRGIQALKQNFGK